eukprot:TRINITY_DN10741_c1_g6_i1.p1 TRINITY_DN10741_c1_g6~~TRINITY_DN10741_c1_g6_i1.p1  ORF type:complete len:432 (+),score=112.01 TRINITY_DN10741_c1_g6_i1:52-1347(+)
MKNLSIMRGVLLSRHSTPNLSKRPFHSLGDNTQLEKDTNTNKKTATKWSKRNYYLQNTQTIKKNSQQYRLKNQQPQNSYRLKNNHILNEKMKNYRLHHKQAIRSQNHLYYLQHKPRLLHLNKLYTQRNQPTIKERLKQYRIHHHEAIRDRYKLYCVHHKEVLEERRRQGKGAKLAKMKEYYLANKLIIQEKKRIYYCLNKEAFRIRNFGYRLKHAKRVCTNKGKWDVGYLAGFFGYAAGRLYVEDPKEWYRISRAQIGQLGGGYLFKVFGGLGRALGVVNPEVDWDQDKISDRTKKASQRWLRVILGQIVPVGTPIFEDFQHPDLLWDEGSNHKMELDIWVPTFNLALEYQGEQHYYDLLFFGSFALSKERDLKKKSACESKGISILHVPFWWDRTKESLWTLLVQFQPDLIFKTKVVPLLPLQPLYQNTT